MTSNNNNNPLFFRTRQVIDLFDFELFLHRIVEWPGLIPVFWSRAISRRIDPPLHPTMSTPYLPCLNSLSAFTFPTTDLRHD
jgi:hypothetical protein